MTDQRPTDELTAKVVAGQYCKEGKRVSFLSSGIWYHPRKGSEKIVFMSADPRNDTNAAMELLHWVLTKWKEDNRGRLVLVEAESEWQLFCLSSDEDFRTLYTLPLSGQPFRYAVVNLVAKVMD